MPRKQVIALGGGGFSMEPDNPLLDRYILNATGKRRPKVCFLAQATGESPPYLLKFFEGMARLDARPSLLSLFRTPPMTAADMEGFLLTHNVIYVGGGNVKSLMILWRGWGIDIMLRKAYEQGVVLAGISAGANCWFEECVSDSVAPQLSVYRDCLGLLPGSFCPHYDGEPLRRPTFQRLIAAGQIQDGIACEDGAAAHYVDGQLMRVVSSRPNAQGYRLTRGADGKAMEREVKTAYLGERPTNRLRQ
jgi:peptidase E